MAPAANSFPDLRDDCTMLSQLHRIWLARGKMNSVQSETASEEGPAVVGGVEGTMVDGFGDEVLVVAGSLLALSMFFIAMVVLSRRERAREAIHPAQAAPVQNARREMGVGSRPERGTVGASAEVESCPICLSALVYAVETNCGHVFCSECILTYWQHDQWPRAARCAVCRRPVTLLLPSPSLHTPDGEQLWRRVSDYNLRMSGQPRPLMHYLYDVPTLLRHLWQDLFTVRGLLLIHKIHIATILLFLLLYCLSPLDIIPESVVGALGFLDDLLIIAGALVYVTLIYRAHVANAGMV